MAHWRTAKKHKKKKGKSMQQLVGLSNSSTSNSGYANTHGGNWGGGSGYTIVSGKGCTHPAKEPVMIGGFPVWLGAYSHIDAEEVEKMDRIYPLCGDIPKAKFGQMLPIVKCTLTDYGGVPANWVEFIKETADLIKSGKKILAYCIGSHGRTGCFAASLIAHMEPDIEDPIEEIRARHCKHAVESHEQRKAIFEVKGVELPEKYKSVPKTYGRTVLTHCLYKITGIIELNEGLRLCQVKTDEDMTIMGSRFWFTTKSTFYEVGQVVKLKET